MRVDLRHDVEVSLQGNIAAIELNNIFQFFDYAAVSGELRIVTEQNNAHFFFQQGMLIYGTLGVNQRKIGNLLLESKLITSAQLSRCLDIHRQHQRRRRLGEILVKEGFLQLENLAEILKIQAKEAFFATLSWKKGMFFFYSEQYPAKEEILINERIDHLQTSAIEENFSFITI
jgi:hypothetical protein